MDDEREGWWKGKALDQSTHERINRKYYPGTRQLCARCGEPTGRCEDDTITLDDGTEPACPNCREEERLGKGDGR